MRSYGLLTDTQTLGPPHLVGDVSAASESEPMIAIGECRDNIPAYTPPAESGSDGFLGLSPYPTCVGMAHRPNRCELHFQRPTVFMK